MTTSKLGRRGNTNSQFENLENRTLFAAFGQEDPNFGTAGRAVAGFSGGKTPAVQNLIVYAGGKILAGGTSGMARFGADGAIDTTFGTAGKVTFAAAATFVAEAVDPSNNSIYVLVSAASGTGLFRYTAKGKIDTTFGSAGTVTVTTSKTFIPQALTVQADGKIVIGGVFKTDSGNGRKVRVYRLKTDGKSDTAFNSTGSIEFNFGQSSFLANTVYDQVVAVKVIGGSKIAVIGGSIDYTPEGNDPDSGDFIPTTYDKAIFAIARLKTDGTLDGTYGSSGITRSDYADETQIGNQGISGILPSAAATRTDDSVLVGGFDGGAVVGEFDAAGAVKYTTTNGGDPRLGRPRGLTALADGRSVLMTDPLRFDNRGYSLVALSADGTLGNVVFTTDDDDSTPDVAAFDFAGALAVASGGQLLAGGGGDSTSNFVVEQLGIGKSTDPRPDDFLNARTNDIAIDNKSGIHFAYYDAATTHLVYAHRNPNGVWDKSVVVDSGANAGQYVAIDFNSKNLPGIAYFDGTNGNLKLAQFNGSKWVLETVDSKGSVGLYPSLDYDNADEPVVTYFNKTKGKLTFALKKLNKTWGYENVDASGDNVGRSSVLVASPKTNRYTVAYVNNTTGSVMWAAHQKGGTWQNKVAAKTKGGADFLGMAYGFYYEPMISYYDAFASDLKITSFYNGQFNIKTLATSGAQGLYSAAFFGNYYGSGSVFAYNKSKDKVTLFNGAVNTTPDNTDVVTAGGRFLSVASTGSETELAYFDGATGAIKVRPGPAID